MVPTAEERAEAEALGLTAFRNASQVGTGIEKAELVAGLVPEGYRKLHGCRIVERKPVEPAKPVDEEPTEENTRPAAKPATGKAGK
jgi:hypothetical protein